VHEVFLVDTGSVGGRGEVAPVILFLHLSLKYVTNLTLGGWI
jgi:hypothetical protein